MFYDVYVNLCQGIGKKPSTVAEQLGINKSTVTNWKKFGYTPRGDVLQRIADFFDVSVDDLLGNGQSPVRGERQISDEDIMFALWGDASDISRDDLEDVRRYASFIRERKQQK